MTKTTKKVTTKLSLDLFRAANQRAGKTTCELGIYIASLSADNQKAVKDALADPLTQHSAIWRVLNGLGFKGGRDSIRHHRTEGCTKCGMKGRE